MTVPWGNYPDGTFDDDLSGLSGLNEASWRAGLNARVLGSAGGGTGFNGLNKFLSGQAVELAGLQSTTQKLLGIIGYAHGYITGGWSGQLGPAKRGVTGVIGPTEGVTRQSGAYYLHSKGLWSRTA
ncbi:hypothetical protein GS498_19225, partial [Rhodococcus hoagii]|nr:hypothetical protein [Prescottella equi]